jgi:hypothetical protein
MLTVLGVENLITIKPFAKEKNTFKGNDFVCYCFEYTRKDIEHDFIKNGKSMILKKIALEKKNGGCDCATKNPKGR